MVCNPSVACCRLIYTKAYKKLYWEQMARVGCTVTGISADSAQMLQVSRL